MVDKALKANQKLLKKQIKQIHKVICSFQYEYFFPLEEDPSEEALRRFEKFREQTLFKLVDQWKKAQFIYNVGFPIKEDPHEQ